LILLKVGNLDVAAVLAEADTVRKAAAIERLVKGIRLEV
jgi:hypothetical protein